MIIRNNVAKFVIAVALMLFATFGTNIVGEQLGFDVTPSVYASDCSTSGGNGGGC